jgi:hypothetical protein
MAADRLIAGLVFFCCVALTAALRAAESPVITGVTTGGAGLVSLTGTLDAVSGTVEPIIGSSSGTNSWSYVYVHVAVNDGGLVNFRYRLSDSNFCGPCYLTLLSITDSTPAPPNYGGSPTLFVYDFVEVTKPFGADPWDSGWVEYTFELQAAPRRSNEQTFVIAVQGGSTKPRTLEFNTVRVIGCTEFEPTAGAALSTSSVNAAAAPSCPACCVAPLSKITDAEALLFEGGQTIDIEQLTDSMATGLDCFRAAVQGDGGRFTLTSAFRPIPYQVHVREVWDKNELLKKPANATDNACIKLAGIVAAEMRKHALAHQPAKKSKHNIGEAIDTSVNEASTRLTLERLLELADGCNLYRRIKKDPVHFEVKP